MFLSYSAIKKYGFIEDEGCPYAYFLSYVSKFKPKKDNCRNFYCGGVGHNCLERWVKEGKLKPGYMQSIRETERLKYLAKNRIVYRNVDDNLLLQNRIKEYIDLIEHSFFEAGLDARVLISEHIFKIWLDGWQTWLYTRTDLIDKNTNDIFDMKVTKNIKYFDVRQGIFAALLAYIGKRMIIRRFGQFVPLRKELIIWHEIQPQELVVLLAQVKVVVQKIKAEQFLPKPEKQKCYWCNVAEFCDYAYIKPAIVVDVQTIDGKHKASF